MPPKRHQASVRLTDEQLRWIGTLAHLAPSTYGAAIRAAVIVANAHRREWVAEILQDTGQDRPARP